MHLEQVSYTSVQSPHRPGKGVPYRICSLFSDKETNRATVHRHFFSLGFYVFAHLLCCQMPASNTTLVTAYWRSSHDKARGFLGGSEGTESACNVGDSGSTPGLQRPPEEGSGNPL